MRLAHIVATSKNRVIGVNGKLPWHLPEDLKFFRQKTIGHAVIMGNKTFQSVGRKLPDRHNIVVTRSPHQTNDPSIQYATSIDEAIELARLGPRSDKEIAFIIGGGEIYRETLDDVGVIYQTEVNLEIYGDTFYPIISEEDFELDYQEHLNGSPAMTFKKFSRVTKGWGDL